MSRSLTGTERDYISALAGHVTWSYMEVQRFDGTWMNLGALSAGGSTLKLFVSATISDDIDKNTLSMSAVFKRESGIFSLVPFMTGSPINDAGDSTYSPLLDLHRGWRIMATIQPHGTTPTVPDDYREMATGIIDRIDISGSQNTITIQGRGMEADIIDAFIAEDTRVYGPDDIGPVIQAELDDQFGAGVIPLTLDSTAPSFFIEQFTQEEEGEMAALTAIASLPGANLRYLYDSSDVLSFTLFTPRRDVTTPDWQIGGAEYETLDVGIGLDGIRNFVVVKYVDAATGQILTVTSPALPDSASIERYGLRVLMIDLSAKTQVTAQANAQALADAVVSDLELPFMESQMTASGLWFVALGDYVQMLANGVHYDEDQYGAVVGYTHTFANGMLETKVSLRGKPAGRYKTWLQFGGVAGELPAPPTITSADATFRPWHPPQVLGLARLEYVVTGNETTQSVLIELSTSPTMTPLYTAGTERADLTPNVALAGYFDIYEVDFPATFYVRLTPYSGPVVSGANTGDAGEPATVNAHAESPRATTDSVTAVSGDVATLTTTVAGKAPSSADYLVKTANAGLTAERVVTDTPSVTWDWTTAGQAKANVVGAASGGVPVVKETRSLSVTANATIMLGTFTGGTTTGLAATGSYRVTLVASTNNFNQVKTYYLTPTYDETAGVWQRVAADQAVLPNNVNDMDLEINVAGSGSSGTVAFRIVRIAGAVVGNVLALIEYFGETTIAWTASSTTGTSSAPAYAGQRLGSGSGGAVSSVFGRTGAVVKVAGDYAVADITGAAPLASPAFTGNPTAPTQTAGNNSTRLATTAYADAAAAAATGAVSSVFGRTGAVVKVAGDYAVADVTGAAPLASPTFTGTPAAPTAVAGTSTTQLATTAFVAAAVTAGAAVYIPLTADSPPTSPSALDDEFSTTQTGGIVVPTGWTGVNWSGLTASDVHSTKYGALHIDNPQNGAGVFLQRHLLKSLPAGDFSVVLDVLQAGNVPTASGNYFAGLALTDGTTNGAGNQAVCAIGYSTTVFTRLAARYTNFTGAAAVTFANVTGLHTDRYVRISRSGSNYSFSYSPDLRVWNEPSGASGVTMPWSPLYVGIVVRNDNTGNRQRAGFNFFRYNASPTALFGWGSP